jgi:magnesium transporter
LEDSQLSKENILKIFEEFLDKGEDLALRNMLVDLHAADIAEALVRLEKEEQQRLFSLLKTHTAAEVVAELDEPLRKDLLEDLSMEQLVQIIGEMDSDDATDVIGELDEEKAQEILALMPWKEFREVKTLLRHDEESAGGIMALEIVAVDQEQTTLEAQEVLRQKADEVDDVYNIYVVDRRGVLKGVVSLKDLVLADTKSKLSDIMDREAVTISADMDQEEVANIFHKYDLVAAPVVDQQGRLVGRITVDDVLDVVEEEASEDITMMAGITDEQIQDRSLIKRSSVRLPWLLVALVGEIVSALVLSRFEVTMHAVLFSAFFIPLIMAMGGNTGIQSATIVIRGLAIGDFDLKDTGRQLFREISVAIVNGLVIAIILLLLVSFWQNDFKFGLVLGISLIAVLFIAAFMGTLVPFILKWSGVDPAIATGPFITTTNDVLGLLVYFGVMKLLYL